MSTTFFSMASRNETHVKFIQDFLTLIYGICRSSRRGSRTEVFCRPTFFHRKSLVVASEHEIQALTLTAGREQEEEFSNSPGSENTNEEEENSTKETNSKSLEDELDIELFVDLVRQLPVIWNTLEWI